MPRKLETMAVKTVMMPISAQMTQVEQMIADADGAFKKRVEWQGTHEKECLVELDTHLNEGFTIVDVQQMPANNFHWLRYTLHKPEPPSVNHGELPVLVELKE
jgi:hypothetical protein